MRAAALIVAAGRGSRFGGHTPKQYVPIKGPCAFRRSVERFLSLDRISTVQTVIHTDDSAAYDDAMAGLSDARLRDAVTGGDTRAASVLRGLQSLEAAAPDVVLIHDAARPFVPVAVIDRVLTALADTEAAFAALPVVDALWRVEEGEACESLPRNGLWRAQTPQGFHFAPILAAHLSHGGDATDDVEIARAAGMKVQVVEGDTRNFKITSPSDLARAEALAIAENGQGT